MAKSYPVDGYHPVWPDCGPYKPPKKAPKPSQNARRLMRVVERDGDLCHWCRKPLGEDRTLEHVIRLADGGADDMSNWRAAHAKCNNERHGIDTDICPV